MQEDTSAHVVAVADELFYTHGVHAVTMQRIRDASGVPLKTLYRLFPSKNVLLAACLARRDRIARSAIRDYVGAAEDPVERALGLFDFLHDWFRQPGFHGCVFAGAFGEAGAAAPEVVAAVQAHKQALRDLATELAAQARAKDPRSVGAQLAVLFDGAMALATFTGDLDAAQHARRTARTVLDTAV
ncbi:MULTISPECIES: TetR/AcrR family transcriptional regulator [unclassified Streptomyces]|uniref:TetR/AcrR family transcriptional regulator n=1 Tax=unclassified Streptomyces TaxID=2593676 RepID=UPI0022B68B4D|nr:MULTISPECIES: TetR/AcrR family transcriptional regulator [unclassified Streptomyces]MCZ7416246.1 helix-turn-helix domain containing protein [Streptomyces sp. WMMC897]MCZ7433944.1 helix-turn-helix domain containing protein [Streptomyces sp. WMMC1477]